MSRTNHEIIDILNGVILEQEEQFRLNELCEICVVSAEWIIELVDEGILEPCGQAPSEWLFPGGSCRRIAVVRRLQRDLGINLAGAALALELQEEIIALNARLESLLR